MWDMTEQEVLDYSMSSAWKKSNSSSGMSSWEKKIKKTKADKIKLTDFWEKI